MEPGASWLSHTLAVCRLATLRLLARRALMRSQAAQSRASTLPPSQSLTVPRRTLPANAAPPPRSKTVLSTASSPAAASQPVFRS